MEYGNQKHNEILRPREACGVFGVYGHPLASQLTYLGLYALQHRGQESAGIVVSDGENIRIQKGMGLVSKVFNEKKINELKGNVAIGHVRYSTTGGSLLENAQPIVVTCSQGDIAIGHNGNLVNAKELREMLESQGSIFQTTADSEILLHLITRSGKKNREEALGECLKKIKGAYSLVLLWDNDIIGVRDPQGFRPLCMGELDGATILASETCALDLIGATFVRDVEPGEVVIIGENMVRSLKPFGEPQTPAYCVFENIYFSRPDSSVNGHSVHIIREKLGQQLAKEHPVDADLVVPVPDSGNSAALGYAQESGIPFDFGFIRNHYVGRTFIQPNQFVRDKGVSIKLNPVKELIKGKRIVVVDDSIVRGTTSISRVCMLKEAGAKEVHLRISCPPHKHPCYYGIDFPSENELIANGKTIEEVRESLGADSLGYLSEKGMMGVMSEIGLQFCAACYTGKYPVIPEKNMNKKIFEKRKRKIFV